MPINDPTAPVVRDEAPGASESLLAAPAHVTNWLNALIPQLFAARDIQTSKSLFFLALPSLLTPPMARQLRRVAWNTDVVSARRVEYNADILLLSETHLPPGTRFSLPAYNCYRQDRVRPLSPHHL